MILLVKFVKIVKCGLLLIFIAFLGFCLLVYQMLKPEKVSVNSVVGIYLSKNVSPEQKLVLNRDGTYQQIFNYTSGEKTTNAGIWYLNGVHGYYSVNLKHAVIGDLGPGDYGLNVARSFTGRRFLDMDDDQGQYFEHT